MSAPRAQTCTFIVYRILVVQSLAAFLASSAIEIDEYFPDERDALLQLRDTVNSTLYLHGNWTGPPCHKNHSNWAGIVCLDWHVTQLVLEGIQMTGSLPPTFLQSITFLTRISFRNNSLYGPLPSLTDLTNLEFVFLSDNNFSGSIPSDYTNLAGLTTLELQENHLTGSIPPFNQKSLIAFNVSHNSLEGLIPETPVLERFPKSSYDNNSDLCGAPLGRPCPDFPPPVPGSVPEPSPSPSVVPPGDKDKILLKWWSIALIAAAVAIVSLSVIPILLCCYRRVNREQIEDQPGDVLEETRKRSHWSEIVEDPDRIGTELEFFDSNRAMFNLDELLRASAEVIGEGKLGVTYKVQLESGSVVAVKRLMKEVNGLSKKDFLKQMHLLGKTKQDNLVEIISFYYSKEEKLMIFEYVPSDSLFYLLHGSRGYGRMTLDWNARLGIIKDIAKGLKFLHESLPLHKVPHGNLQAANVLVQRQNHSSFIVKLTDYGFFPLLSSSPKALDNLALRRTPEFAQGKKLTSNADIYCFGIVILEIITGKLPAGDEFSRGSDLLDWVRSSVNSDWSADILDMEILAEKEGYDDMLKMTEIALECCDASPENRPSMSQVFRRIEEIADRQQQGR